MPRRRRRRRPPSIEQLAAESDELRPPTRGYRSMSDVLSRALPATLAAGAGSSSGGGEGDDGSDAYSDVKCDKCKSGDHGEEMLLCDGCDRGFHLFCLRPIAACVPLGPWFCSSCGGGGERRLRKFPKVQTKIVDFFRIEKCSTAAAMTEMSCRLSQEGRKYRKHKSLVMYKKRRRLLPYIPSEDQERRLTQMASLATALTASKMEFSNGLTYNENMAARSLNRANLEYGGMQVLSREDTEVLELCRIMHKCGECPPLLVVFDSLEGFTVQADGFIKDMTLITEYAGDVDLLVNRENDDFDSMMTLLVTDKRLSCLVICPDKRGNISRFINGINNHTEDGKKKENVKCVRYDVGGECHVLLVACRDITCGERLYYDYNGYEHAYPTHHFV